jgi:hypothetical protein
MPSLSPEMTPMLGCATREENRSVLHLHFIFLYASLPNGIKGFQHFER